MAIFSEKIRWINVVLFFSLALNFFIAGYLVSDTRVFKGLHVKKNIHKRPNVRIVDYFPHKEKRAFRKLMFNQHEKIMPIQRKIMLSQKEFFKVISEEQVDGEKLKETFKDYQSANDQLQTSINDIVVEMVLMMDQQTRLDIIERGKKAHEHRKGIRSLRRGEGEHIIIKKRHRQN